MRCTIFADGRVSKIELGLLGERTAVCKLGIGLLALGRQHGNLLLGSKNAGMVTLELCSGLGTKGFSLLRPLNGAGAGRHQIAIALGVCVGKSQCRAGNIDRCPGLFDQCLLQTDLGIEIANGCSCGVYVGLRLSQ
jgi:hypothetical protein